MLASRYMDMLQNPNTPFLGAWGGYGTFLGNTDGYMAQITPKENQIDATLKVVMQEDYRVLKHGFLETELKRAKEELLYNYEIAANEIDKTESSQFANEYSSHFLQQDPIPGAKRIFNYAKKYLNEITLEEVNALAKNWITKENISVVITAPEKEGVIVPTEKEILAILKDASLENVEPYIDTYKEQEMVDVASLQKGEIVAENVIAEVGVTELTLNNGIRVWLKKTDFKNDEILFKAISKGGMSLYGEADLASGLFAADFVNRAGISEIDYSSLMKKMKGKQVGIIPKITVFTEEMTGLSTPKDLEFFFQYLHAFFASPRYDPNAYELVIKENIEQHKMIDAVPIYRAIKNIVKIAIQNDYYAPHQFTSLIYTDDFINSADYDRAFEIYKERFANPADFNYVFVGNFDEKMMREYLELYLGSLPTSTEREGINPAVTKEFPTVQMNEDIFIGTEEQSFVGIVYQKEFPWSEENKTILRALNDALQIELIAEIREKMSGVYSPILLLEWNQVPKPEYVMVIFFGCAPNNTDNLSNAVFKILKDMQQNGPSEETMIKVKQQLIKARETGMKTNAYWQQMLANMWIHNDDVTVIPTFEERINNLTAKDIAGFLQMYFDTEQYVRVNLYPEK
jgi:zinc protease